jgi:DUF177 domain-containing protein
MLHGAVVLMLKIDLRTLEIGRHEFNLESTAEELGVEPGLMSQIRADVQLHYDGEDAIIIADVSAIAHLTCDRTLVKFDRPLKGTHTVLYSPKDPNEDSDADVRPLAASDQEIDITDIVRDTLLLAIPVRKLAPGAENTDIRTTFGETAGSSTVDPRWAALAALKESADTDHPEDE